MNDSDFSANGKVVQGGLCFLDAVVLRPSGKVDVRAHKVSLDAISVMIVLVYGGKNGHAVFIRGPAARIDESYTKGKAFVLAVSGRAEAEISKIGEAEENGVVHTTLNEKAEKARLIGNTKENEGDKNGLAISILGFFPYVEREGRVYADGLALGSERLVPSKAVQMTVWLT